MGQFARRSRRDPVLPRILQGPLAQQRGWMAANVVAQRPLASEEVYAVHNVILSGGQNFVALAWRALQQHLPGRVRRTPNNFPGGIQRPAGSGATVVEFYTPGTSAPVDRLGIGSMTRGGWVQVDGGNDVTTDLFSPPTFSQRGFSINLPDPLPEPVCHHQCAELQPH
jgi:hypothetical protein